VKYLLLLAFLGYLYYAWRKQRLQRPGPTRTGAAGPASPQRSATQEMVPCAACGLHLPTGDALTDGRGRHFCSAQHRDQAGT